MSEEIGTTLKLRTIEELVRKQEEDEVKFVLQEVSKLKGKFYAGEITAIIEGLLKMRKFTRQAPLD